MNQVNSEEPRAAAIPASGEPVRWGILSTARINDVVLEAVGGSELAVFEAVASRDAARAATYAAERNLEAAYGSYEELLSDSDVDAVYITLPNSLHVEWAIKALEAGKHVLCEKPLSRDPAEAAAAFDCADRNGLLLAEAFMYRYHPQTQLVRRMIGDGQIGEIQHVHAALTFTVPDLEGDPRNSVELDGGALMDAGCYCLSAIRLFAGEPSTVFAVQTAEDGGVDKQFAAMLRFASGAVAQFDTALTLPRRDRLELVGSEGVLLLDDPWHCRSRTVERRTPPHESNIPVPDAGAEVIEIDPDGDLGLTFSLFDAYRYEVEAFSRAVRGEMELEFGRDDAVAQAKVIEALLRSAAEGRPVELT